MRTSASVASIAASTASASLAPERGCAGAAARSSGASPAGFATPCPAICGAEPCTGSKRPGPSSPREADAARPRPPVTAAATSERMSPNVFSVRTTSIVSGAWTIVIANESTSAWSSGTSGYSPAPSSVTTSRHRREVCMHVDLVDRRQRGRHARGRTRKHVARSARPQGGSTRRCRTTSRPRGCPWRRSRGRRRSSRTMRRSIPSPAPAGGSRRRRAPCAARAGPARAAPAVPRARAARPPPRRTAVGRTAGGEGLVGQRRAAGEDRVAAERMLASGRSRARRARGSPRAATSGPIPSPGRTATCVTRWPWTLSYAAISSSCCERERDLVEPVQRAGAASTRRTRTAISRPSGATIDAALEIDRHLRAAVEVDASPSAASPRPRGSVTVTRPILPAFVRKMSPNEGATTTSKP